ncbi:hypothetical protein SAMN05192583_1448 [Sphingomonas gellani]|uniref:Uncharacterized protein n=1 Tax=Sphingomonas gellani TaxID=1166340 RepID=A0A1H8C3R2_9SPHN|nr:hypothetical protein [Sphingomonas gellani]SEM89801.1 hypothetical protein SAMN05192583_1448 [Sphingomonas gellani]
MRRSVLIVLPLLAGCATRTPVAVVTPPPEPTPVVAAPMLPPGATPGMRIPAVLADGSYPTPNRNLTAAAAVWHLRAGLNVAALSCQGVQGTTIIAAYNALLAREKAGLAAAEARYSAEYRAGGGDWRDRYDDSMTRLYNYYSQTPARPSFCAAAERILAAAPAVPAGGLDAFARAQMPGLDQAFVDFYRAYDAWRIGSLRIAAASAAPTTAIAVSSPAPLASVPAVAVPSAAPVQSAAVQPAPAQPVRVLARPTPAPALTTPTIAAPVRAATQAPPPAPQPGARPYPRLEIDPSVFGTPEVEGR